IVSTNLEKYKDSIEIIHSDVFDFNPNFLYKFITMGEVLEHVEDPRGVLKLIYSFLAHNGKAYISTCTNCPAIDHVYHFKTIDEIREMICSEGFRIDSEVIEPAECCSEEKLIKRKIDILYGAIISKG
ncbi:MAG: methyltransferase domain-containing protein, partial [Bacteriovorax sp.]|nr:methyltransferase domain-containing protein [Bacteriovorax sp.]